MCCAMIHMLTCKQSVFGVGLQTKVGQLYVTVANTKSFAVHMEESPVGCWNTPPDHGRRQRSHGSQCELYVNCNVIGQTNCSH